MARMPSNRFLADALPLGGVKHLCDCGGGAGRNAMALARKHPDLRVTIFDQPSVCEEARRNVAAQGLGDRIGTHAGNFLQDPFPPGVDAVLYSHIGSIWSPETNVGVFRRAHAALPAGGRFFVFNMVPNDHHTGPLSVTTGSVYFHVLATGEGLMHSVPDYAAMLREAGFSEVATVRDLPVSHAIVTGIR
jgi:cyclopropane fatty-acyl-phospholipid synthase-like methyltransferase